MNNLTLIVPPSSSSSSPWINEGLQLLTQALEEEEEGGGGGGGGGGGDRGGRRIAPSPFHPTPLYYNGTGVLAIQTLYVYDWTPTTHPPTPVPPHTRLCAPAAGLQLLRSTLLPLSSSSSSSSSIIYLARDQGTPRSIGNEVALLSSLSLLAQELSTHLSIHYGTKEGQFLLPSTHPPAYRIRSPISSSLPPLHYIQALSLLPPHDSTTHPPTSTGIKGALNLLPTARVVVGVHGANLANAVFAPAGARLVELTMAEDEFRYFPTHPPTQPTNQPTTHVLSFSFQRLTHPPTNPHREYEHLASAIGLLYRPLKGEVKENGFEDVVWVNVERVVAAVRAAWLEEEEEEEEAVGGRRIREEL